jgi:hypothetical protein
MFSRRSIYGWLAGVFLLSSVEASAGDYTVADPTLGGIVAAAISDVAGIDPPRSWPGDRKQRFKSLPYDLQVDVADHEARRERAVRRAQNEAAIARQKLAAFQHPQTETPKGIDSDEPKRDESDSRTNP